MQKICKKIIEKYCFLVKTFSGKNQRRTENQKKGEGALNRAGAHIRNNTVLSSLPVRY